MRASSAPARPRRRRQLAAGAAVALLIAVGATATTTWAHDFWLVPNAFTVLGRGDVVVRGQTSSLFPTSESAVAPERVADARLISARGFVPIRRISSEGRSLVLRQRPEQAGQYVVAVRLAPRLVRESPESFRRYLQLEGAPEALARYEREGRLPTDSITRRYAKYAKTVVQVGRAGGRAFARAAGHPAELLPLRDPAGLRVGDTLPVELRFRGRVVPGAHLHAGAFPAEAALTDTAVARVAAAGDVSLTTDATGTARVVVDRPGTWNVRTLHIVPADPGSGADWDVHWATLVFEVSGAPRRGAAGDRDTRGAGDDSASVAGVVAAFHRALQSGDSLGALRLLAPDVMILESGGVETRDEYRSHHLPGDIAYARGVPSTRTVRQVRVHGGTAWVSSTSVAQGTFNGRVINSSGAELVVLTRGADQVWRIAAIHWSSRARRTPS